MTTRTATDAFETRNETWGFYGEMARELSATDAAHCFKIARNHLILHHGLTKGQARDYLDSKSGRHLADALSFTERHPVSGEAFRVAAPKWLAADVARWLRSYHAADYGND